jgi:hypothetical protein
MKSIWATRARIIPNSATAARRQHQQRYRSITTLREHNLLIEAVTERDVVRYLGPDYQRNYKLEAIVRMVADHLIVYETMDNVFNQRRLEVYNTRSLGFDDEDRKRSALADLRDVYLRTGVVVNQPLLDSLSIDLLNQTHSSLTTSMKFINENVYHKYLNRITSTRGSGPLISVKDHGKESYRIRSLKATERMNNRLIEHLETNFFGQETNLGNNNDEQQGRSMLQSHSVEQGSSFLSGIADILMNSYALPNLKTFNLLIRQLNAYRLPVPARMVTDALLLSGLQLNNKLYNTMLKLAISTGDKSLFMKLAAVIDCNSVSISSNNQGTPLTRAYWDVFNPIKMSSYKNHDWPKPTPEDVKFGRRFFEENLVTLDEDNYASSNSNNGPQTLTKFNLNEGVFSVKLFTTLISGLVRFGWFWWVDVAIRKMTAEGFPLTLEVLTQNMQAATATKDAAKVYWTWAEMLKLPLPTGSAEIREHTARDRNGFLYNLKPFDYESFIVCTNAARAIKNSQLAAEMASFYKEVLYFKVNLSLKENKDRKKTQLPLSSSLPLRIPFFSFTGKQQHKSTPAKEDKEEGYSTDYAGVPTTTSSRNNNNNNNNKSSSSSSSSSSIGGTTNKSTFKLDRVQLPAGYKNASGIVNGGLLLWDPAQTAQQQQQADANSHRLTTSRPRDGLKRNMAPATAVTEPKRWFDNL